MKKLIFISVLILPLFAFSQGTATPTTTADAVPDGSTIAQQGTKAGVPACIACHGAKGEGNAASAYPMLAGQSTEYMIKQLHDFASDVRVSPVMAPIAKALTDAEKEKVSQYYAQMEIPKVMKTKASASAVQLGQKLARIGDQKLQVQACNNCHGPDGRGAYPAIPRIAGQHAKYIQAQLKAWKDGARKNQVIQMAEVAQRLDEKSIQAVSAYFQQVQVKEASGSQNQ
jgi:cytochrome c553